ncbi:MAG: hypothetical protein ACT4P7_23400 [Gemmatimonadaceae bacterium]
MPGKHLPPDHEQGDANTIGGYMAVHARPAAFEGSDGMSYSVSIEADATGEAERPYGAYFLFLRWRRMGQQGVEGHLETGYLEFGQSADDARAALGRWMLTDVKRALDTRIRESSGGASTRRWWDAMRDDE